jgi:hypothetical protein
MLLYCNHISSCTWLEAAGKPIGNEGCHRGMNLATKAVVDTYIHRNFTPAQTLHNMTLDLPHVKLPPLGKIQRRTKYVRDTVLEENNNVRAMQRIIRDNAYNADADIDSSAFFTFAFNVATEEVSLNIAHDATNFQVGFTSKELLRSYHAAPGCKVFHWDATYKINSRAFPILVCGWSDVGRCFHPLAFFILSNESTQDYTRAINSLRLIYKQVCGADLRLDFVMGDAAGAQHNAITAYAIELGNPTLLMCFWHMLVKVKENLSGITNTLKNIVFQDVYKMHFARSQREFAYHWKNISTAWMKEATLASFATYFARQWVNSRACNWQVFHTPVGFACTNNPSETFNKIFKGILFIYNYISCNA